MSEPIKQPTATGDPASGDQGGNDAPDSKQPASNADEAAAWAALVRWREGVEAPLRARVAELARERDEALALAAKMKQRRDAAWTAATGFSAELDEELRQRQAALLAREWDEALARLAKLWEVQQ